MAGYVVPRSDWPGDKPPAPTASLGQLSSMPSAYRMQQHGLTSLSELVVTDLQLGLGVDTAFGDYVRVAVNIGNSFEGFSQAYGIGVDLAGAGSGSIGFVDKPAGALPLNIANTGDLTYQPNAPQDIDGSIPEDGVSKDAEKGQAVVTQSQDDAFETVSTVSYGTDEAEEIKPTYGDGFDDSTYANPDDQQYIDYGQPEHYEAPA